MQEPENEKAGGGQNVAQRDGGSKVSVTYETNEVATYSLACSPLSHIVTLHKL